MMDYTLDKYHKQSFVLKYEVKNGEIIVYYADNKTDKFEYSLKYEKLILKKMRNQILDSKAPKMPAEAVSTGITSLILLPMTVISFYIVGGFLSPMLFLMDFTYLSSFIYKYINHKILKNDYLKYKYYVEHQDTFDLMNKSDQKLVEFDKKITKKIDSIERYDNIFDINSIDDFSKSDLIKIKTSLEKYKKNCSKKNKTSDDNIISYKKRVKTIYLDR